MKPLQTHPEVPVTPATQMLPQGCALVLEGGGTRCAYTSGVLDALLTANLMFPYIVGVSVGGSCALSYLSGQIGRNKMLIEHLVPHSNYLGLGQLALYSSYLKRNCLTGKTPKEDIPLNWESFRNYSGKLVLGAMNCNTGENHWFTQKELDPNFKVLQASCSIPFLCSPFLLDGIFYLDGGAREPIPIQKSLDDGNQFHVIILTQNGDYLKSPHKEQLAMAKLCYSRYPKIVDLFAHRHQIYNDQLALCQKLEREGKALILRPLQKLTVGGATQKKEALLDLYRQGEEEGTLLTQKILSRFVFREKHKGVL